MADKYQLLIASVHHSFTNPHAVPADDHDVLLQARQVRQSAAENLGELTRMSMRVDQLATDLINNARAADPAIQEAYLTALRGMLLSTGQRLSPAVLSKAGETLQSMMATAGMHTPICTCLKLSSWIVYLHTLQTAIASVPAHAV